MDIKDEVCKRLETLSDFGAIGVNKTVTKEIPLKEFFDFEELPVSENMYNIVGTVYKGHDFGKYDKLLSAIAKLKKMGHVPYYIMVNDNIASILFVSGREEEWQEQRRELSRKRANAFCGYIGEDCWEIGEISFANLNGGLVRIK